MGADVMIQARMGSTRLPGKVLMNLEGKPLLQRIIERVAYSRNVRRVIVATSSLSQDDDIALFCKEVIGCSCFRGNESLIKRTPFHRMPNINKSIQ